jgi:hypothetical protein
VTAAAVPVPVSGTVWGLPAALSVTEMLAVRLPLALGLKLTENVQLPPAASVLGLVGHVFVWPKSAAFVPPSPIAVIVSAALPEFVRVTVWAAPLVPTTRDPKPRLVGENDTAGAAVTPVPVSVSRCGLPVALSVTATLAVRVPLAVGLNVTEIVQVAFTARVLGLTGQVLVCA